MCTVPNLVGLKTNAATSAWTSPGFTGTVIFLDPLTKPPWTVGWQSQTVGASILCTSDVNLAQVAPSP
jgi:hypothetical protein